MIVIMDVVIRKVDGRTYIIPNRLGGPTETVFGTEYVDREGNYKLIGISKKVKDTLGIPLDCIKDQRTRIAEQNYEIKKLLQADKERQIKMYKLKGTLAGMENKLLKLKRLTIWGRLVFLLTGRI
jgi:hypothetical protein